MSQTDFLRDLDAQIMSALGAAGMADAALYGTTPVDVYVNRNAQFLGDHPGIAAGQRVVITFRRDQVAPARGGILTLGAETFLLNELVEEDESLSSWVVTSG